MRHDWKFCYYYATYPNLSNIARLQGVNPIIHEDTEECATGEFFSDSWPQANE